MSYTRRFTKTISVSYSGSVSYPASQSGGSTSYHGTTTEEIVVEVEVVTDPFDDAVRGMNKHVDLLTGSVVAAQGAHIAAIDETSKKVGDTIISGFFKTVKSDITQQIAELTTRTDALLLQLNQLAARCNDKKRQMGVDYQRLAERYGKIFTDLNNELENRIYSIDEPVFNAKRNLDDVGSMTGKNGSIATVSVVAGENAQVHSKLVATLAKRQAINAIGKGNSFLQTQYATNRVIKKCLMARDGSASLVSPYCVIDSTEGPDLTARQIHTSPLLRGIDRTQLEASLDRRGWDSTLTEKERLSITDYFNNSVAEQHREARDEHDRRVADMTMRLFDISATATPGK